MSSIKQKLCKMSINELRDLLTFVDDDPVKAFVIRDMISQKVNIIKLRKKQIEYKKKRMEEQDRMLEKVIKELEEQRKREAAELLASE